MEAMVAANIPTKALTPNVGKPQWPAEVQSQALRMKEKQQIAGYVPCTAMAPTVKNQGKDYSSKVATKIPCLSISWTQPNLMVWWRCNMLNHGQNRGHQSLRGNLLFKFHLIY